MNTGITQKLRNFRGDNCVHAEPVCIEAADYIEQQELENSMLKQSIAVANDLITAFEAKLSAQAEPAPSMICSKCEIDRFKEPCPNHQDCPMIAYASAHPAKTEQPGLSDAAQAVVNHVHAVGKIGAHNMLIDKLKTALLSQRQDSVKDAEESMCPNCVTPWKCNGPHIANGATNAQTGKDLIFSEGIQDQRLPALRATGVDLIVTERERQISREGWTAEHDDEHDGGELAIAAALYATPMKLYKINTNQNSIAWIDPWPWHDYEEGARGGSHKLTAWDKRKKHPRIKQLVIAGALIAAEIDRLQRASKSEPQQPASKNSAAEAVTEPE